MKEYLKTMRQQGMQQQMQTHEQAKISGTIHYKAPDDKLKPGDTGFADQYYEKRVRLLDESILSKIKVAESLSAPLWLVGQQERYLKMKRFDLNQDVTKELEDIIANTIKYKEIETKNETSKDSVQHGSPEAKVLAKAYTEFAKDGLTNKERATIEKIDDVVQGADIVISKDGNAAVIAQDDGKSFNVQAPYNKPAPTKVR